jgi:hypothetical protein
VLFPCGDLGRLERVWHSMSKKRVILNHKCLICTSKWKTNPLTKKNLQINSQWNYFQKLTLLYHACPKGATSHSATPFWQPPRWLPVWHRGTRLVRIAPLSSLPYRVVQCHADGRHSDMVPVLIFFLNPSVAHFTRAPCYVVPCPTLGHYTFPSCQEFIFCPLSETWMHPTE